MNSELSCLRLLECTYCILSYNSFPPTDQASLSSRPVQYRNVDLGSRSETTYADIVFDLSKDDKDFEFDFGIPAWYSTYLSQHEDSDTANWEILQHDFDTRSAVASLYEPLPPLSIISEADREAFSRPSTSSTNRKDSGEFLRHLQTGSSVGSILHSRNVSDISEITLPFSEHGYDIDLLNAPPEKEPSMLETMPELDFVHSNTSSHLDVATTHGMVTTFQGLDHPGDMSEEWLQAPPYLDFEWYEVNDIHESISLDMEKQMATLPNHDVDESYFNHEPQKPLFLHVEQQSAEEDTRSFISTCPEDTEITTKSYGKFDAAFTQQVKDYSKLLDDLADPDATAQALELVSTRLSMYLNNNSSASVALSRPPVEVEPPEKRQQMILPDLTDLDAFLDDDDDADSGFHVGRSSSIKKVFACPAKPRPTPFADLQQFISDDDLDFDVSAGGGGHGKPVMNSFADWALAMNQSNDDDGEVLFSRTALRTKRPGLRRTCWEDDL